MAVVCWQRRLLYIHIPKTGGTTVEAVLAARADAARHMRRQHTPARDLPSELLAQHHVFATLRRPRDWYLSYWRHAWNEPETAVFGGGTRHFRRWLYGVTHPSTDMCPDQVGSLGPAVATREQWLAGAEGLWSQTVRYYLQDAAGRWLVDRLIALENVRAEMSALLEEALEPRLCRPLNRAEDRPEAPPLEAVIDEEMIRWIERADWRMLLSIRAAPVRGVSRIRWLCGSQA